MNDPILKELHEIRERLLAESGGTLAGLVSRLQKEQAESGRVIWVPQRTSDHNQQDDASQTGGSPISTTSSSP